MQILAAICSGNILGSTRGGGEGEGHNELNKDVQRGTEDCRLVKKVDWPIFFCY